MPDFLPDHYVLIVPRLRIQNANAISSPMTWGFPAITAFTGLMTALERKLGADAGIRLCKVGVVCHHFEAQTAQVGYDRVFCLTRNPLRSDGKDAPIMEEGRIHLEISLIFDARLTAAQASAEARAVLAQRITDVLAEMRCAGGSILPSLPKHTGKRYSPILESVPDDGQPQARDRQFRHLARFLLPGFALAARDDLLAERLADLQKSQPQSTVLDAWLDLSRLNSHAREIPSEDPDNPNASPKVVWETEHRPGWIVPIPVGYAALTGLQGASTVANARDNTTPVRFAETVWSIGQWISPHRFTRWQDLYWYPTYDQNTGLYRCTNEHRQRPVEIDESLANEAMNYDF